ncbi:MAG TPA: ATP-binding protein [Noviherbaspirillum sp.]|nr:ATP-binding protein [Noviherbaspirillum sp.]
MFEPISIPAEHFQRIFESAPGSFLLLLPTPAFTIAAVTDDYLRDTLTTRAHLLGKPLFDAFPDNPSLPEAHATRNLRASLERVLATRSSDMMAIQRYDVPRRDGTGFEVRYWTPINTPVLSAGGDILYIVHRVKNVTDYVRLQEENEAQHKQSAELDARNRRMQAEVLQQSMELDAKNRELRQVNEALREYAQKARDEARHKDEFLAMLAHELRNPLAGISSALELLQLGEGDQTKNAQLHEVCRRQLGNLVRLVDDLLDVSRISRGAVALRMERLDLRDVVESALYAVRSVFDDKGLAVATTIRPGAYQVLGDATRLEQVLSNLMVNAAKFTQAGGKVEVTLANEQQGQWTWSVVQVTDSGRGIPQEKLDAIFDLFVQVDAGIDRARGGLGIGLPLARKLAEMHGGSIVAESRGTGFGSSFIVRLPNDADSGPVAPGDDAELPKFSARSGTRVLVIDDNADARETLKSLLEAYGFCVDTAATGEEGLERLLARCHEIALVDIGLPGLDGFEVARKVRRAPSASHTRLVALTGYSGPETERRVVEAGFDLHLVKPVRATELQRIIDVPTR